MKRKSNIQDVAQLARVSTASVSYVLNGIGKVSAETRQRILDAVRELDYQPDLMAKGLSSGNSKLIGVTLPITEAGDNADALFEHNPFFSEFLSAIIKVFSNEEYDIVIRGVQEGGEYREWVRRRNPDGLIMLGAYPKSLYQHLKKQGIPVVMTDIYSDEHAKDFHLIRIDDEYGGYLAARHLIDLGHRRIAFAAGNIQRSPVNFYRRQGYIKALSESGIAFEEGLCFDRPVTYQAGYELGRELVENQRGITAIFAAADIMAIGIMKAFLESGKRIPEDLSVIGFDDIHLSRYTTPGLTTVKQDILMKGRLCAQMVLADLKNKQQNKGTIILRPELTIRQSTAPISTKE